MKENITIYRLDFGAAKVSKFKQAIHDARLQIDCAWCRRTLKPALIPSWILKTVLSHGICPDCSRAVLEDL